MNVIYKNILVFPLNKVHFFYRHMRRKNSILPKFLQTIHKCFDCHIDPKGNYKVGIWGFKNAR